MAIKEREMSQAKGAGEDTADQISYGVWWDQGESEEYVDFSW